MFNIFPLGAGTQQAKRIIKRGAGSAMTELRFFEMEIKKWKASPLRKLMLTGERYYAGEHDILKRKRMIIGEGGKLQEVENLPNNRLVDNQYAIAVDKKVNYLVGKPISFDTEKEEYGKLLGITLGSKFCRLLQTVAHDSLNGCRGWIFPYYNAQGELAFQRYPPWEIIPFWRDADHTDLELAIRIYEVEAWEGEKEVILEFVEIFREKGIDRYELVNGHLVPDAERPHTNYITIHEDPSNSEDYNWGKVPLVAFPCNPKEQSLIKRTKGLQDAINTIVCDFMNNMQEDSRNTIIILVNYDGTDLGQFRRNLSQYGAVKVRSENGANGDVRTLTVEVNADNYKSILAVLKNALIENARSFDAKDDRMSQNPNQMNIQSMYADIDLDANAMETQFQASMEELLWFVNVHFSSTGKGDFKDEAVKVIFNRDMLINETEAVTNCRNSVGIISNETIVAQHPFTGDVKKELERIQKEKQAAQSEYDSYRQDFDAAKERLNGGQQKE